MKFLKFDDFVYNYKYDRSYNTANKNYAAKNCAFEREESGDPAG